MMTETDKLRALLDGRGVEHNDFSCMTEFTGANGRICRCYTRPEPLTVDVAIIAVPAEQAVDAALGRGECEPVMVDADPDGVLDDLREGIAKEHGVSVDKVRLTFTSCSVCGETWNEIPNYCPNCGRRVKGEL